VERPDHTPAPKSVRWVLMTIVILCVSVRLTLLIVNIGDRPRLYLPDAQGVIASIEDPSRPNIHPIGFEYSNIAYALLATDEGFASPFGGRTGPTAWSAPGPVLLFVAVFAAFGPFSPGSVLALYAFALLVSAALTLIVFAVSRDLFDDPVLAALSAGLFALAPYDAWIFRSGQVFDLNLCTLLFATLLWLGVRAVRYPSMARMMLLAFATAGALYFYPRMIAPAGVAAVVATWRLPWRRRLQQLGAFALIVSAIVGPYVWYQSSRIGALVFIKSNPPFELFLGNTPEARGLLTAKAFRTHHPSQSVSAYRRYQRLGEAGFLAESKERFAESFDAHTFMTYTLRRILYFFFVYQTQGWDDTLFIIVAKKGLWALLGVTLLGHALLRRSRMSRGELLVQLVCLAYAAPYLLVSVMDRYKTPIAPAVIVLLASLGWRWGLRPQDRHSREPRGDG
jgi:hypothetical protein